MRPAQPKDLPQLHDMLVAEGLAAEQMAFADNPTWVLERSGKASGFFTIRPEWGRPFIVHFCTARGEGGRREAADGWALVRGLKGTLRAMGARKAIISVPCGKEKILNAVRRLFRGEVYAVQSGETFLTMEV